MPLTSLRISIRRLIPPKNPVLLREDTTEPSHLERGQRQTRDTRELLKVGLLNTQKSDLSILISSVSERNFENALDKLENLDQAVDPPKEPGPVEGEGHHVGGSPVKRAEADQGYEGYGA